MNIAIIFAGGTGVRMNSKARPKQFLELHGKSIIIHTLEHFQRHNLIDDIAVVCLDGWEDNLWIEIKKNYINKVRWMVKGGENVQESIYNGLVVVNDSLKECNEDIIVMLHDGVRPLIDDNLITKNIETVKKYGNSITVSNAMETVVSIDNNDKIVDIVDRDTARIAKAPQCFYLEDIMKAHERAKTEGVKGMIDSASLMKYYGHALHTVSSSPYNIKITSPSDYYIFRALYEVKENSQILGLEK